MKKRLISLLLAGCMTAMLSVAAFAADTTGADAKDEEASLKPPVSVVFKDVPVDAWYTPSVQYVYNHDIMIGVSADRFAPEVGFNRAMVVQTMYNRSSDKTFIKNAAPTRIFGSMMQSSGQHREALSLVTATAPSARIRMLPVRNLQRFCTTLPAARLL